MALGDPLFIFRLCPVVLELLELRPEQGRALLLRCNLPASAALGSCTAPLSRIRQLLDEAARLRTERFGVLLAAAAPEGTYDTAELLVRTAPSLGHGLRALARYAALINPVGRFELRTRRGSAEVHYFVPAARDALGRHLNEFTIAYVVRALAQVTHEPLALRSVWFAHRDASAIAQLAAHFGCAVTMGAATCGFALAASSLELPLRTSDPVVWRYLERQAEAKLEALDRRDFSAMVVDAIENQTGFASADLDRVARLFGATPRTLQRRLADDGTSFREVLDAARKRRAEVMLGSGTTTTAAAAALGFADVRSFRRAFKRWTA